MILQQNHYRIAEYSQKAFKIFCKRALGIAIIKSLKSQNIRERDRAGDEIQDNGLTQYNKLVSEKSIAMCSGVFDESQKAQSIISQLRKTQLNFDKCDKQTQSLHVTQYLRLAYGDLVEIHCLDGIDESKMKLKCSLNKVIGCQPQQTNFGYESDSRCIYEIVNPNSPVPINSQRLLLYDNSLVCFRNIAKNAYICLSNKVNIGEQFGIQTSLTKVIDQRSIFLIRYTIESQSRQKIYTGNQVYIKDIYSEKFLSICKKQYESELIMSSVGTTFILQKQLKRKTRKTGVKYFYIKNNYHNSFIKSQKPKQDSLFTYRVYHNAYSVNQLGIISKIPPISSVQCNYYKNFDGLIDHIVIDQPSDECIWELIQTENNNQDRYYIYSPISKLGLVCKINNSKILFRLTSNPNEYTKFYIEEDNKRIVIMNESKFTCLEVIEENYQLQTKFTKINQAEKTKYFSLVQVPTKKTQLIRELCELIEILLIIFEFFNEWGLNFDKKSDAVYYRVKQIKLYSSELILKIRETNIILSKVSSYFTNYPKQIQETIRSTHMFTILIELCKIMMQKIWPQKVQQNSQQSPFFYAKSNIQELLFSTLYIILKIVTNNKENSNIIIAEAQFFNKLLLHYPECVGLILQEAIKNLTLFTINNVSHSCNQLFLWVKLIETVKQQTLLIQKTYIDIISEVVVDPNDKGIIPYQNKCKQLIFIQGPSKKKGIPKFGFDESIKKAYILFEPESKEQFLSRNPLLQKMNVQDDTLLLYYIESFFQEKFNKSLYDNYVKYIISIVRLFRNLVKDRNKKLIKIINDWGITHHHLFNVLVNQRISWELKSVYLDLYTKMYVDQDPFLVFDKRESICHSWDKIRVYNIMDHTALIFRQYTNLGLAMNKLNEFSFKITPILNSFFSDFHKKVPTFIYDKSEVESFLRILKIVYEVINFGFLTIGEIKDYISIILSIFSPLRNRCGSKKNISQDITKLTGEVIAFIIKILDLFEDIMVEIHGIRFLQTFHDKFTDKSFINGWEDQKKQWEYILMNNFVEPLRSLQYTYEFERKKTKAQSHFDQIQGSLHSFKTPLDKSLKKIIIESTFQSVDQQILEMLVALLCKNYHKVLDFDIAPVMALLEKKINRIHSVSNYLQNIMILNNQEQQQIYKQFNGRQPNKLLNCLKIQELTHKIVECESSMIEDNETEKRKKQKILELNNTLVKIIRQINGYRSQSFILFKKSQVIQEKLKIHIYLLQILKFNGKKIYKEVLSTIFAFFQLFITDNPSNSKVLSKHLPYLSLKINFEVYTRLIPKLFPQCPYQEAVIKNIINCFKKKKNTNSRYLLQITYSLLKLDISDDIFNSFKNQLIDTFFIEIGKLKLNHRDFTFQYVRVVCELAQSCSDLRKKIKSSFTKQEILNNIIEHDEYEVKTFYMLILVKIYMYEDHLQHFEVQELAKSLFMPELIKLPNICLKTIDRSNLSQVKEMKLSKLLEQISELSQNRIMETSFQQGYFKYLLDSNDETNPSLLVLIKNALKQWSPNRKSIKLIPIQQYLEVLQKLLESIFYEKTSKFLQKILFAIEDINLKLKEITNTENQVICFDEQIDILNQQQKKCIINFYYSLGELLIEERISVNRLFQIFGVKPALVVERQQGKSIEASVTQQQFLGCFDRLRTYVCNQQKYQELIGETNIFKFITYYKDKETKLLDLCSFLEKLSNVLEQLRNRTVQKQIMSIYDQEDGSEAQRSHQREYSIEQLQNIEEYFKLDLNQYRQFEGFREVKLVNQIEAFCQVAKQDPQLRILKKNQVDEMIRESLNSLSPGLINQWIVNTENSIFKKHIQAPYSFMFTLSSGIFDHIDPQKICHQFILNFSSYLKAFLHNFKEATNTSFLDFLKNILRSFSSSSEATAIIEDICLQLFGIIMEKLEHQKSNNTLVLFNQYQQLFCQILKSEHSSNYFKNCMKVKSCSSILAMLNQRQEQHRNFYILYRTQTLEILLNIWSINYLKTLSSNQNLFESLDFINWINDMFSSVKFHRISKTNIDNLLRNQLIGTVARILADFFEHNTCSNLSLINLEDAKSISINIFNQSFFNKENIYSQQDYCFVSTACTPYFCNSNKVSSYDLTIVDTILKLFIIVKVQEENKTQQKQKKKSIGDDVLSNMIISIRYVINNQINILNFKKPHLSEYLDGHIKEQILQELRNSSWNSWKLLPILGQFFHILLVQNGRYYRYFVVRNLVIYKNYISCLLFLGIAVTYAVYLSHSQPLGLAELVHIYFFIFIILFYLILQTKNYLVKVTQFSLKRQLLLHEKDRNHTAGQLKLIEKVRIGASEFFKTHLYLYYLVFVFHLVMLIELKFMAFTLMLMLLLFPYIRKNLYALLYGGVYRLIPICLIFLSILLGLIFVFYLLEGNNNNNSLLSQYISNVFIELYSIFLISPRINEYNGQTPLSQNFWLLFCIQIIQYLLISSLLFFSIVFGIRFQASEQESTQKCFICHKSYQEITNLEESFSYHTQKHHNIWNYMYFFQAIKSKSVQQSMSAQLQCMIENGDFSFIDLTQSSQNDQ